MQICAFISIVSDCNGNMSNPSFLLTFCDEQSAHATWTVFHHVVCNIALEYIRREENINRNDVN